MTAKRFVRTVLLERCHWCGDWFEPHALEDVDLTDRTIRACDECRAGPLNEPT